MPLLAALLALAAAAAPAAPSAPAPASAHGTAPASAPAAAGAAAPDASAPLETVEHALLPRGPVTLRTLSLESTIALEVPPAAAPAVERALRRAPRTICPDATASGGEVRLRCRSRRVVARLLPQADGVLLQIRELDGLPWTGEDGPPLAMLDPTALGLGEACPGSSAAGRAECLLSAGDRAGAKRAFQVAASAELEGSQLAVLRLGDLAAWEGDLHAASQAWGGVRGSPWERLAAARLCELASGCLAAGRLDDLYDGKGLPAPVAEELLARRARALAFLGRPLEGARLLLASLSGRAACSAAAPSCRRVLLQALRLSEPEGAGEALGLWTALPERGSGASAYELDLAAAALAEAAYAPAYAANVLAAAAGRVPAGALPRHLLRTAELYLAADDRIRAGVVVEFARSRLPKAELASARWSSVLRAAGSRARARAAPAAAPSFTPPDVREVEAALAAAVQVAASAHAVSQGGRP